MGGRDLRVGGGAESEARKRKRNRAVQQKKSYDAAKKSCHSTREVEQCGKKWRVPERSGAIRGKSWALPNESPLFAQKVSDFSASLGRKREQVGTSIKQVAVIARKVGALVRRTGFLE